MNLIREVSGISIYVNDDGRFIAEVGDKVINKPTLREVEREIGRLAGGLPVVAFDNFTLRRFEFIAFEKRSGSDVYRDKNNQRHQAFKKYYKSTPQLISQLTDLQERYHAAMRSFEDERWNILEAAERVKESDFRKTKVE